MATQNLFSQMWPFAAMQTGSNILTSLFGGGGPSRQWKETYGMLKGNLNKDVISDQDIAGIAPFLERASAGAANRTANWASSRYGMDSGVAGAEVMKSRMSAINEQMPQMKLEQILANLRNRQMIQQMLAGMVS